VSARDGRTAGVGDQLSARESVYLFLRQKITTGEYRGGVRLVEEQIADDLGVSRTPIREALQRLTSDGLVSRVRRGQLIVVDIDARARAELHELRIAYDQVAAKLLTEHRDEIDWPALYDLLSPLQKAHTEFGSPSPQFEIAHLELHMATNRAAFSPVISSFLDRQAFLYPTDDYVQQPGHEPISQHRALLDDLASADLERARTAMRVHALRGYANTSLD
jgi:DNA-binding GntR family transcriptional regulator